MSSPPWPPTRRRRRIRPPASLPRPWPGPRLPPPRCGASWRRPPPAPNGSAGPWGSRRAGSQPGGLLVLLEAPAQAVAGVAEVLPQVAGPHGLGHLLPAGPPELAQVALEQEGTAEHHEEPDESQEQRGGERGDEEGEAGDEPEGRPLQVAAGVAVQGGRADLPGQCRVVLVELLLDFLEDSLFVFRQRHVPSPLDSQRRPTQPSSRSVPRPTTRGNSIIPRDPIADRPAAWGAGPPHPPGWRARRLGRRSVCAPGRGPAWPPPTALGR